MIPRSSRCTWVQIIVAALIGVIALAGCAGGSGGGGSTAAASSSGATSTLAPSKPTTSLPTIPVAELPSQAVTTLMLIEQGGPFPYSKDGATFGNREGLLPPKPSGFYREYTVKKPDESDRGPWRIVTGKDGSRFWTADHYASFEEVVQS